MDKSTLHLIIMMVLAIMLVVSLGMVYVYHKMYHQAIDYGANKLVDCTMYLGICMEIGNVTTKDIMNTYIDMNLTGTK